MRLPVVSGLDCIKVASKLGFFIRRRNGSHVILRNNGTMLVVPMHQSLKTGTFREILKTLNLSPQQFEEWL